MSDVNDEMPAVHLGEIGQVAITVTDLPRAKTFYQDTLGMTLLFDAGSMVFFQCGTVRLMIGLPEAEAARGGTILYFKVADLDTTTDILKKAGVAFTQDPHFVARMPTHELWMAFLKDPDENVLGLMSEIELKEK